MGCNSYLKVWLQRMGRDWDCHICFWSEPCRCVPARLMIWDREGEGSILGRNGKDVSLSRASKAMEGKEEELTWEAEGHEEGLKFRSEVSLVCFPVQLLPILQSQLDSLNFQSKMHFCLFCAGWICLNLLLKGYATLSKAIGNKRKWISGCIVGVPVNNVWFTALRS